MELPVVLQATQFALSVALGACLGIVYDFFRALRRLGSWLTVPLDILYAVLLLPILLLFALYVGRGQLRLFMLAGCMAGGSIYFLALSRAVYFTLLQILKLLCVPFKILCREILHFFSFIREKCKKNLAITKKNSNIDNREEYRRKRSGTAGRKRRRGDVLSESPHQVP